MRPVGAGVVDGALQVLELVGVDDERLEVVVAVRVVHGALQRPKERGQPCGSFEIQNPRL